MIYGPIVCKIRGEVDSKYIGSYTDLSSKSKINILIYVQIIDTILSVDPETVKSRRFITNGLNTQRTQVH